MVELSIWLAIYFCAAFCASCVNGAWARSTWVKALFLPSVAAHALCRALGSFVSFSPIERVDFFAAGEPFLRPGAPRLHYIGNLVSVLVTHGALFGLFFYATLLLPISSWEGLALANVEQLGLDPIAVVSHLVSRAGDIPADPCPFWVICYLFVGLALSFDVNARELASVLVLAAIGWAIGAALVWLGFGFSFLSRGWFLVNYYVPEWWGIGSAFIAFAAAGCLAIAALRGASVVAAFVRSRLGRPSSPPSPAQGRPARRTRAREKVAA